MARRLGLRLPSAWHAEEHTDVKTNRGAGENDSLSEDSLRPSLCPVGTVATGAARRPYARALPPPLTDVEAVPSELLGEAARPSRVGSAGGRGHPGLDLHPGRRRDKILLPIPYRLLPFLLPRSGSKP